MPNSVSQLYGHFRCWLFPFVKIKLKIDGWGQLCFDDAAARAIAYHMCNNNMRYGWTYVSWSVDMNGPCVGGAKRKGLAPRDFSIAKYGPSV